MLIRHNLWAGEEHKLGLMSSLITVEANISENTFQSQVREAYPSC